MQKEFAWIQSNFKQIFKNCHVNNRLGWVFLDKLD